MRPHLSTDQVTPLDRGWRVALTPAGACKAPADAAKLSDWIDAPVPGTVAEALRRAERWQGQRLHDQDAWYRLDMDAGSRGVLRFEGLATLCEVWLNDSLLATHRNMFSPLEVAAEIRPGDTLWLCFRALGPIVAERGPRVRWRPPMITPQGVRTVRTTLFGHMPAWCPEVDAVGSWRRVALIERGALKLSDLRIAADYDGRCRLTVEAAITGHDAEPILHCGGHAAAMAPLGGSRFRGEMVLDDARPWFPRTHGEQPLYPVAIEAGTQVADLGRIGFRRIEVDRGPDGKGFGLVVNGAPVFCRGACWSSAGVVALPGEREAYRPWLELLAETGGNMVRLPGTGVYETAAFHRLCDELGLMVWQDFMLANFDYPTDDAFGTEVAAEAEALLARTQGSPSLAVLCGGSEVFQQAAMMGLAAQAWGGARWNEVLAPLCAVRRPDVPFVANSPSGGALPFVVDEGVGHYFGVGAYLRPLEDARRANVRFASECLAFANLPQGELEPGHHVPRDRGADWDFADVREHYLGLLHRLDPKALKAVDPALWRDLSRGVTGEVMAASFDEWRRAGSPTRGGLVLALQDLQPGAGWGVIDAGGEPKPAFYALKRAWRPVQLALTDEGVNGLAVQLINERAETVEARVELTCLREGQVPILRAERAVSLPPRSAQAISGFELIGAFFDLTYAYRFGPPEHDAVVVRLLAGEELLAEAAHFPQGRGRERPAPAVQARVERDADGWSLVLATDRLAEAAHIEDAGFRPEDDWFCLTPGREKRVRLIARSDSDAAPRGEVRGPGGRWRVAYQRSR